MNPEDVNIPCPYNRAHQIIKGRMQFHLTRCRAQYTGENAMVRCPFNSVHVVCQMELPLHMEYCPGRITLDTLTYDVGDSSLPSGILPVASVHVPNDGEEDWEDDSVSPPTNVLEAVKDQAKEKPILMGVIGKSKAVRKEHRAQERLRFQQVNGMKRDNELLEKAKASIKKENSSASFIKQEQPRLPRRSTQAPKEIEREDLDCNAEEDGAYGYTPDNCGASEPEETPAPIPGPIWGRGASRNQDCAVNLSQRFEKLNTDDSCPAMNGNANPPRVMSFAAATSSNSHRPSFASRASNQSSASTGARPKSGQTSRPSLQSSLSTWPEPGQQSCRPNWPDPSQQTSRSTEHEPSPQSSGTAWANPGQQSSQSTWPELGSRSFPEASPVQQPRSFAAAAASRGRGFSSQENEIGSGARPGRGRGRR